MWGCEQGTDNFFLGWKLGEFGSTGPSGPGLSGSQDDNSGALVVWANLLGRPSRGGWVSKDLYQH